MQKNGMEPWQAALRLPRKGKPSRALTKLQRVDRSIDQLNRQLLWLFHGIRSWEDRLRLRYLDGLSDRLGIRLSGNAVLSRGLTFRIAELRLQEEPLLLNYLHAAHCPLKRIDIGSLGSTDIQRLVRWVEEHLRMSGLGPSNFLDQVQTLASRIATDQLVWTSWLIYPTDYLPRYLADRLSPLEIDETDLWTYLSSLFSTVSEFDPASPGMLSFLPSLLRGDYSVILPGTLVRSAWGIESGGGRYHRTLRIVGLGAELLERANPQLGTKDLYFIRHVDWLRDLVLPLLYQHGEQIMIATTLWGVHERNRAAFAKSEKKKIKQNPTDYAEVSDLHAREEALDLIKFDTSQLPYRQSIALSLSGTSREQVDELYLRVRYSLANQHVLVREVNHPLDHWNNFRTFVPDIRRSDIREYTAPLPSKVASVSMFRGMVRLSSGMGALIGYYTEKGEPLIIPVGKKGGGNYLATGTTGSGKSLWLKYFVWQLLPLDAGWYFRIMDNSQQTQDARALARGWKDEVEVYDGAVLFADDDEFKNPEHFRQTLVSLGAARKRVILFTSAPDRSDLDEIWLKWLISDIQVTGPGVVAVDEMINWFIRREDPRSKMWVYDLLKIMRTYNKISCSTIQTMVPMQKEQPGVHGDILTLTDGGKFAFYDPNEADLPPSLGIPDNVYPELATQIRLINRTLKEGKLGPLQRPGYCSLITPPDAAEVKIEAEPEVLAFLGRKDPTLSEALLWGD